VPVLRENDVLKKPRDPVDDRNHLIAARNGQLPARAEVILHVDYDKNVLRSDLHKSCDSDLISFSPIVANACA
jgi:hypothetical protein